LASGLGRCGYAGVGVEPATASLEVARAKDERAAVDWIRGDAAQLPAVGAELAVMTGNVAQVFLSDTDWAQALAAIGGALRPHGYLVFETRRPRRPVWHDWAPDPPPLPLHLP